MMDDYEPASGENLPAGCFDVPDVAPGEDVCGYCKNCIDDTEDYGVCAFELQDAYESGMLDYKRGPLRGRVDPYKVVEWVRDHHKDMQEDTCARFS